MRKLLASIVTVLFVSGYAGNVFGDTLLEARKEILDEAALIKSSFKGSEDIIFLSSLWDAAVVTGVQLEAYFFMVGVIGSVPEDSVTPSSIEYLLNWLESIKATNSLNVRMLQDIKDPEAATVPIAERLIDYYTRLNSTIEREAGGLDALKRSMETELTLE